MAKCKHLKVLIICEKNPTLSNVTSLRALYAAKYLTKKYGYNVTLLGFEDMLAKHVESDNYNTIKVKSTRKLFKAVNLAVRIPLNLFGHYLGFPSYSLKFRQKAKNLLKKEKFDVIFVNHWSMFYAALGINTPKVLEVLPLKVGKAYKDEKKIIDRIRLFLQYTMTKNYEKYYKEFDICVTVIQESAKILKSSFPELKTCVIPYGVDIEYLQPRSYIEEEYPSLLFVGNLGSRGNVYSVLNFYEHIYPKIKAKIPKLKFYIVGKNPPVEIKSIENQDRSVVVTGYVEDIRTYYCKSSVVIVPSIFMDGTKTGFRTRILEAMAMRKAIVTAPKEVYGIDITPEENIIIADSPKEFAKRVIELLNNHELRNRIGASARKLVEEEYSWEKMTDMLNDIFQKVVNGRRND